MSKACFHVLIMSGSRKLGDPRFSTRLGENGQSGWRRTAKYISLNLISTYVFNFSLVIQHALF